MVAQILLKIEPVARQVKHISPVLAKIYSLFEKTLYSVSPALLWQLNYLLKMGKMPDLQNPQTFNEKIAWLMFYWRHPLKAQCADKYEARSYIQMQGLGHILPKLLGVYSNTDDIRLSDLPQRFVLKCTHGCGFNVICYDKDRLDWKTVKQKLDVWMKTDISKFNGEIHYAEITPRIICEQYLEDGEHQVPIDYKVYCFGGRAYCTLVCTERESGHPKFDFYDREWKNKLPYSRSSLLSQRNITRPDAYQEMIDAAEILSRPFPFVRVDFYIISGKVVFGEMTFTPSACIDPGYTDEGQINLGRCIELPPEKRA